MKVLKKFLYNFKEGTHIYITGGEPLLSDNLIPLIDMLKDMNFNVGLFTTFNANKKVNFILDKLSKHNLDDFYVSIYDSRLKNHDFITQVSDSGFKSLLAIKNARKYDISPKINLVLLRINISRIEEVLKDLDALDAEEIRILRLVTHGAASENWERIGISDKLQIGTISKIYSKVGIYKTKMTFSGFPLITKCRPFESIYNCGAGKTLIYIDYYGNIYPCGSKKCEKKFCFGNILEYNKLSPIIMDENKCFKKF